MGACDRYWLPVVKGLVNYGLSLAGCNRAWSILWLVVVKLC